MVSLEDDKKLEGIVGTRRDDSGKTNRRRYESSGKGSQSVAILNKPDESRKTATSVGLGGLGDYHADCDCRLESIMYGDDNNPQVYGTAKDAITGREFGIRARPALIGLEGYPGLKEGLRKYQKGVLDPYNLENVDEFVQGRDNSPVVFLSNSQKVFSDARRIKEASPNSSVIVVGGEPLNAIEPIAGYLPGNFSEAQLMARLIDLKRKEKLYASLEIGIEGCGYLAQGLLRALKDAPEIRKINWFSKTASAKDLDFSSSRYTADQVIEMLGEARDGVRLDKILSRISENGKQSYESIARCLDMGEAVSKKRIVTFDDVNTWAEACAKGDLVFFATGPHRDKYNGGNGEEAKKLLETTMSRVHETAIALQNSGFGGIVAFQSNPVEAFQMVLSEYFGFDPSRIISFSPDVVRTKELLESYLTGINGSPVNVTHVPLIGAHRTPIVLFEDCILEGGRRLFEEFPNLDNANFKRHFIAKLREAGSLTMKDAHRLRIGYEQAGRVASLGATNLAHFNPSHAFVGYITYVPELNSFSGGSVECSYPAGKFRSLLNVPGLLEKTRVELIGQGDAARQLVKSYYPDTWKQS